MTELDQKGFSALWSGYEVEFCLIGAAAALNALAARRRGGEQGVELDGADFLGWEAQRFDTGAGPLHVVPFAAAIGGFENAATID